MSLREELQNYIEEKLWITNDSLPYHTDEILKLFEKRIDSIEYPYNKKYHGFITVEQFKNEVKEVLK